MNFLLSIASSHDLNDSPELVYVTINVPERAQLLRRRAMFQAIRAYDIELTTMEFNAQVEWYQSPTYNSSVLDYLYEEHVVQDVRPPEGSRQVQVECQLMQLDDSGVYWECLVKHTEVRCVSAVLHWGLLAEEN